MVGDEEFELGRFPCKKRRHCGDIAITGFGFLTDSRLWVTCDSLDRLEAGRDPDIGTPGLNPGHSVVSDDVNFLTFVGDRVQLLPRCFESNRVRGTERKSGCVCGGGGGEIPCFRLPLCLSGSYGKADRGIRKREQREEGGGAEKQ